MPLIRDNELVAQDPWVRVDDDAALPEDGTPAIVSLGRWRAERETLDGRNGRLGVVLKAGEDAAELAGDLERLSLVALEFPKFSDGRAFSTARLLRGRYRFRGELRAVGNVLRDQLLFMHRCGFDAYEVARGDALEAWTGALADFSAWYQTAADDRRTAAQQRSESAAPSRAEGRSRIRANAVAASAPPAPAVSCCAGDWAY
jgi:uncharacterized protein (DUF934 family)